MQKRMKPDGTIEVWDDAALDWRPEKTADIIAEIGDWAMWPTQSPTDGDRRFICPTCFAVVHKITTFTMLEVQAVDPEDGIEDGDILTTEQIDVVEEMYRCSSLKCNWEAGPEWWDEVEYGPKEKKEEEVKFPPVKGPEPVQLDLWPPDEVFKGYFKLMSDGRLVR